MKMNKAIAIDLDGTLLTDDKKVSDYNTAALNACAEQGYLVIIATARPLRWIKGLLPDSLDISYMVLANGAWIIKDGNIIARNEIPEKQVRAMVKGLVEAGYSASIEADDYIYKDRPALPGFEDRTRKLKEYEGGDACKVLAFDEQGIDNDVMDLIPPSLRGIITDKGTFLQISAGNCTKESALREIFHRENIDPEQTYAFGDDYNDIPMLQCVYGVAMGNAEEALKSVAYDVADTNENDGVGKWIRENVLG